ncbi:hypothetical protein M9Y10_028376 [Tritrichomonas musculus]|uniref:EamA domain-containing protein n=1 Tax=Tritrichomonas musculus TaxID=1915356 RepID=A0ABR2KMG6_9EUKA
MKSSKKSLIISRLSAFFLLFFGTISSVTSKIQLTVPSQGYMNIEHYFEKPGMQVFIMFFGMSFAMIVGIYWGPTNGPMNLKSFSKYQYMISSLNSTCATVAIFINTVGLTRINVSIFMMLRGSLSIFSTLFSILFLKKKFKKYQWFGIILTIVSLIIVGVAGVMISDNNRNDKVERNSYTETYLSEKNNTEYANNTIFIQDSRPLESLSENNSERFNWFDRLIGIIIIIIAQVIQGWQLVFDEYMTQTLKLPVMLVVGMEGVWGVLIMLFIGFPFCFIVPGKDPSPLGGSLENVYDSLLMIKNSKFILLICIVACLAIGCYDISGMSVTATMSSVHRTIFEALRTLTTWVTMLIIGIFSDFGEKWKNWSWLELAGFILLAYSSFVFNGVIAPPFIKEEKEDNHIIDYQTL